MKRLFSKQSGFTLIELLVVIAIIGVLATVIIASINQAQKKGRDARRVRDIQEIQKAIELYILDNNEAPNLGNPNCSDTTSGDNSCFAVETTDSWSAFESQLAPYLKTVPRDPCGEACLGQGATKYRGYFAYAYEAPSILGSYYEGIGAQLTSSSYRLYAQNLETKQPRSFGFGEGSF